MQGMKFILYQMQGEVHLLVLELGVKRYLFMGCKARQQIVDLNAAVHRQAARIVTYVEPGVVLHALDEIQFSLREDGVGLHDELERTSRRWEKDSEFLILF